MRIDFHRHFDKQFKKLSAAQKQQFKIRLALFSENRWDITLNNHPLKGEYQGYRSINVTGDIRAVFIEHAEKHIEFVYIGSHSQLYS